MPIDANAADADASSYTRGLHTSERTIVLWTEFFVYIQGVFYTGPPLKSYSMENLG